MINSCVQLLIFSVSLYGVHGLHTNASHRCGWGFGAAHNLGAFNKSVGAKGCASKALGDWACGTYDDEYAIMWSDDPGDDCFCCIPGDKGFELEEWAFSDVIYFKKTDFQNGIASPMWDFVPHEWVAPYILGVVVFVVMLMTCYTVQRVYKMWSGTPNFKTVSMEME